MKYILGCSICLSDLTHPVSLHCGHTFCQECILNSLEKSELSACPLCRAPVYITSQETDELIPQILKIYSNEGTETLLNEFPSIIMCLACGLTPINPIVLPCQHMFCQQCLQENLEEELVCPACQDFSINLEVHVNTKYKDLIDWYLQQSKIEEEQLIQTNYDLTKYSGLPIFFSDISVTIHQKFEFIFIEHRYKELIKMVGSGSGHFVIINSQEQSQNQFGDLVQIQQLRKGNNGFLVKVQGISRVTISNIYTFESQGRLEFTNEIYKNKSHLLWLCQCRDRHDVELNFKENFNFWLSVIEIIDFFYNSLSKNIQELFQYVYSILHAQFKTQLELEQLSLFLKSILSDQNQYAYYSQSFKERIEAIRYHIQTVEFAIREMYHTQDQDVTEKIIKQNKVNITAYPNLSIQEQFFLNLFNLQKITAF